MLELKFQRTLDLSAREPDWPDHLSAASGLVQVADHLYVVADDELHLGVFPTEAARRGELIRLFDGKLPAQPRPRKKQKPDLEALIRLPAFGRYPLGALLTLGSGSKQTRHRGALLPFLTESELAPPRLIELDFLHQSLKATFDDLNIEGAAIVEDTLVLFQRGNKGSAVNACAFYDLAEILDSLEPGARNKTIEPREIRNYDLGQIDGVPLCFTDASSLPGGELVFTAVAENTDDSYHDGQCLGAAIGLLDPSGRLERLETLATAHKIEGIHAWRVAGDIHCLVVTDPDDRNVAAQLFTGHFVR